MVTECLIFSRANVVFIYRFWTLISSNVSRSWEDSGIPILILSEHRWNIFDHKRFTILFSIYWIAESSIEHWVFNEKFLWMANEFHIFIRFPGSPHKRWDESSYWQKKRPYISCTRCSICRTIKWFRLCRKVNDSIEYIEHFNENAIISSIVLWNSLNLMMTIWSYGKCNWNWTLHTFGATALGMKQFLGLFDI